MRVGIVGTGLIGKKRAQSLVEGQELIGAFDADQDRLQEYAESLEVQKFSSAADLFAEIGPNGLAIICTTHGSLAELAIAALQANCNVLVEKPGARNFLEFEKAVVLANKKGLVLRVGYNHRFHPALVFLKQFTDHNELGPVQLIRATYGHGGRRGYEKEWRASKDLSGGGELLDQGSHLLDLCQYLVGEIQINFADLPSLYWPMEVEDNAFISGTSSSGAKIWLHASWTEWKNKFLFEVFYKTGKVEISGLGGSYGQEKYIVYRMPDGLGIPTAHEQVFEESDLSWYLEMSDIVNQLQGGKFTGAQGHEALQTLKAIGEAYAIDNK